MQLPKSLDFTTVRCRLVCFRLGLVGLASSRRRTAADPAETFPAYAFPVGASVAGAAPVAAFGAGCLRTEDEDGDNGNGAHDLSVRRIATVSTLGVSPSSVPWGLALHEQLWQPGDPPRDPASLILAQSPHRCLPGRLILEIQIGERLPCPIHDGERFPVLDQCPRRRKSTLMRHSQGLDSRERKENIDSSKSR